MIFNNDILRPILDQWTQYEKKGGEHSKAIKNLRTQFDCVKREEIPSNLLPSEFSDAKERVLLGLAEKIENEESECCNIVTQRLNNVVSELSNALAASQEPLYNQENAINVAQLCAVFRRDVERKIGLIRGANVIDWDDVFRSDDEISILIDKFP